MLRADMSIKSKLQKLSFRTGVIVLLMCIPFYILSFVQVFFPVSTTTKGVLFTIFFGLAKSFQYGGIAILGKEGYKRVKGYFKRKKQAKAEAAKGDGDATPRYCPDLFTNPEILSGIRLVIFDFDGTLGDSQKLITDTMLATIERLNLPMRSREECARTIGLPLKECFSSIIPMSDEQAEECAKVYSEIFNVKNVPGVVKAFPGVVETLERLSSQGILMSIASSRSHRTLAKLMDELDLSKYITYLIAADDVVDKKPAAESVLKTLSHFNVEAHETLVVGDTEFDILMGRNAGTHTCGVTYGNGSKESLEAAGAEWIVC
jgi:HAD hydrolase, family IA, variant 3